VFTAEPDALSDELVSSGVPFHQTVGETADGQRGFEIADPDGYILFFGRPR